jgi:hypothetical protein
MNKDWMYSSSLPNKDWMDYLKYKRNSKRNSSEYFEVYFHNKKHPEIKGYTLLQEYPGCNKKVGDFEPYTSGEFSKYPNIWKPVYHKEIEREKKINELLGE